ncbi:hypothetical protein LSAT2_029162, partial [Lamellibrachia satsuma]
DKEARSGQCSQMKKRLVDLLLFLTNPARIPGILLGKLPCGIMEKVAIYRVRDQQQFGQFLG